MVAGLHEFDAVAEHFVPEAIGLVDPPRPDIAAEVFQMSGFADIAAGIAKCGVHQVEHPERRLAVGVDPMAKILQALVLDDCTPSRPRAGTQDATPSSRRRAATSGDLVRPRRWITAASRESSTSSHRVARFSRA